MVCGLRMRANYPTYAKLSQRKTCCLFAVASGKLLNIIGVCKLVPGIPANRITYRQAG